jgi:hypothetical protein
MVSSVISDENLDEVKNRTNRVRDFYQQDSTRETSHDDLDLNRLWSSFWRNFFERIAQSLTSPRLAMFKPIPNRSDVPRIFYENAFDDPLATFAVPEATPGRPTKSEAKKSLASLLHEHRLYLQKIAREGEISQELRRSAWTMLLRILEEEEDVDVPDAIPGVDGKLFYTWKSGEHYLDLEMFPDGETEFFYRNAQSGRLWNLSSRIDLPLPREAASKLRLFRRV